MEKRLFFYPRPKKLEYQAGEYVLGGEWSVQASGIADAGANYLIGCAAEMGIAMKKTDAAGSIVFCESAEYDSQEYQIIVAPDGIQIRYSDRAGAFYAGMTLLQVLAQCPDRVPCFFLRDWPDIKVRGVMLDISRGKIPKMETLKMLVHLFARLKFNQLQLYLESPVFAYDGLEQYWKDNQPITAEELETLERLCLDLNIELVPNQNCFGHMGAWLSFPDLEPMANGTDKGEVGKALNPLDPRSLEFVDRLLGGLLPHFQSDKVHIGFDEVVELGEGKTREICREKGVEQVFLDFLSKVCDLVEQKYQKRPMFWSDMIIKHPQYFDKIPSNAIVNEWGYEADHPFAKYGAELEEHGREFYFVAGTSTWCSLLGRTDNMKQNIKNAAINLKAHHGTGLLTTDWGDGGHPQFLPVSYLGFAWGAGCGWDPEACEFEDAKEYLDRFLFQGEFADLLEEAGNYELLSHHRAFNGTDAYYGYLENLEDSKVWGSDLVTTCFTEENSQKMIRFMEQVIQRTSEAKLACKDGQQIKEEIILGARITALFYGISILRLAHEKGSMDPLSREMAARLVKELDEISTEFVRLWKVRNRPVGYDIFLKTLNNARSYLVTWSGQNCQ